MSPSIAMTVIYKYLYFFHGHSSVGQYVSFLQIICTTHKLIAIKYARKCEYSWHTQFMLLNLRLQIVHVLASHRGKRNLVLAKTLAGPGAMWTTALLKYEHLNIHILKCSSSRFYIYWSSRGHFWPHSQRSCG
ncbi:hypothetical protein FR483_n435L [Paramecium bursaria Chlorella virus FR483]|uniref:Uncharacterized protein n435L n=1 Tax=Paramecium bursaria Chlorella virus FR483 TaxID=399781 RepID=A7J7D9_PBCVF|nr:hypothetical protein FR483_n435L [Paramecium bursaria Chlorella virus FR483]ABT15720.1 hypothetical protein FR483_n435L [Paramecium bursaria Chlorella virus FR483]